MINWQDFKERAEQAYWPALMRDAFITLMIAFPLTQLICKLYFWLSGWPTN